MKRFTLAITYAFLLCYTPIAMAVDGDDRETSEQIIVATVEVDEDEGKKESKKSTGKITIEIDGKTQEFVIGNQAGNVVKKIREVIKDGDKETTVEATIIGQGVIVGPDGKKKEFNLGQLESQKKMLKTLPDEVRKQVEIAIKDSSKGTWFSQGIMIGPDGEKKTFKLGDSTDLNIVLKEIPEEARKKVESAIKEAGNISVRSTGRAIVIGADGGKKEFKFGDGDLKDVDIQVIRSLPKTLQQRIQLTKKDASSVAEKKGDLVAEKLDAILKRLDGIEKDLQALKDAK